MSNLFCLKYNVWKVVHTVIICHLLNTYLTFHIATHSHTQRIDYLSSDEHARRVMLCSRRKRVHWRNRSHTTQTHPHSTRRPATEETHTHTHVHRLLLCGVCCSLWSGENARAKAKWTHPLSACTHTPLLKHYCDDKTAMPHLYCCVSNVHEFGSFCVHRRKKTTLAIKCTLWQWYKRKTTDIFFTFYLYANCSKMY